MVNATTTLLALAAQAARRAAPRLRKAPIELTDAAAERVRSLLGRREKVTTLLDPCTLPSPHLVRPLRPQLVCLCDGDA